MRYAIFVFFLLLAEYFGCFRLQLLSNPEAMERLPWHVRTILMLGLMVPGIVLISMYVREAEK